MTMMMILQVRIHFQRRKELEDHSLMKVQMPITMSRVMSFGLRECVKIPKVKMALENMSLPIHVSD